MELKRLKINCQHLSYMMQSPLKGVERLSEELKAERIKASNALQDRAKLRIENETLKQHNDLKDNEISRFREELFQSNMEIERLEKVMEEKEVDYFLLQDNIKNRDNEMGSIYKDKLKYQVENESLQEKLNQKDLLIASMNIRLESSDSKLLGKDEIISHLERDIIEMRNNLMVTEQEKMSIQQSLLDVTRKHEDLQSHMHLINMMEDGYNQTKNSNDLLRNELEQTSYNNVSLLEKIRELNKLIVDKASKEAELEEMLRKKDIEIDGILKELRYVDDNREQINSRIQAEIDARDAALERAEAAVRGRDFLDQQIKELRQSHSQSLDLNLSLEEQLTSSKATIADLQSELMKLKDIVEQSRTAFEEAAGKQAMVLEMDMLRNQLNEVRRQLIKRDIEEEAGGSSLRYPNE